MRRVITRQCMLVVIHLQLPHSFMMLKRPTMLAANLSSYFPS
jgi:hypothetical protein